MSGHLPQRPLGRTGLEVSNLGFGGAVIGIENYLQDGESGRISESQALATLEAAVDAGITLFDTAPGYGDGRSEALIGRALEKQRERVVIATKVAMRVGTTYADWEASLATSLERLRTDHVDVLQVHGNAWDEESADWLLGEPADWLEDVKQKGLSRSVGVTAEATSGALEHLVRSGRFDVLQIAYSVIYQGACDYQREPVGIIPLAKDLGLGVTTMRTTTSGVFQRLLRSEFPDIDSARVNTLAIKFVLSTPEVDCALVGMSNVTELQRNAILAADEGDRLDLRKLHDFFGGWQDARA